MFTNRRLDSLFLVHVGLAMLGGLATAACSRSNPQEETSVAYWLNDPDPCVRRTAAAIIASGRPWPNETRDERGHLVKFDFWLAEQRYELPGNGPIQPNSFQPRSHPLKYSAITGNAEDFLGVPTPLRQGNATRARVGGTLFGNVRCRVGDPPETWVESRAITGPSRKDAIERAVARARAAFPRIQRVEVTDRADLDMTEVRSYTAPPELPIAHYFPKKRDLVQVIDGQRLVKGIACRPYDLSADVSAGDLCHMWIYLGPGLGIEFQVYQQMLPVVPATHDKLLQLLKDSRRN